MLVGVLVLVLSIFEYVFFPHHFGSITETDSVSYSFHMLFRHGQNKEIVSPICCSNNKFMFDVSYKIGKVGDLRLVAVTDVNTKYGWPTIKLIVFDAFKYLPLLTVYGGHSIDNRFSSFIVPTQFRLHSLNNGHWCGYFYHKWPYFCTIGEMVIYDRMPNAHSNIQLKKIVQFWLHLSEMLR